MVKTWVTFFIVVGILRNIPRRKTSQSVSWKRGELGTPNQFVNIFCPVLLATAGY